MKKIFKVLIAAGQYVDGSLLQRGIYMTDNPIMHDVSESIETMKSRMDRFKELISGFDASQAKEMLDHCQMVEVEIKFI